jgi:hypothetical protein
MKWEYHEYNEKTSHHFHCDFTSPACRGCDLPLPADAVGEGAGARSRARYAVTNTTEKNTKT